MDLKSAERNLPVRVYEFLENILTSVAVLSGSDLSLPGENTHPDYKSGRTDIGSTFEDFHLFWPIRPKTWLSYPEGSKEDFPLYSRDDFLLKEEQNAYVRNDNTLFIGQQHGTSVHQIYSNLLFSKFQEQLSNVYKPDIDLRSNMRVQERFNLDFNSDTREFWNDHPIDKELSERKQFVWEASAFLGFLPVYTATLYVFHKNAAARPLALPAAIGFGACSAVACAVVFNSLSELSGHNNSIWRSRVSDGFIDYNSKKHIDFTPKQDFSILTTIQPFHNHFTH